MAGDAYSKQWAVAVAACALCCYHIGAFTPPLLPSRRLVPSATVSQHAGIRRHPSSSRAYLFPSRSRLPLISLRCSIAEQLAAPTVVSEYFSAQTRLGLLRTQMLEWYEEEDRYEEDAEAILNEFVNHVKSSTNWVVVQESESEIIATYQDSSGAALLHVGLYGLENWKSLRVIRDPSIPAEPFFELRMVGTEVLTQEIAYEIVKELMSNVFAKFSGEEWRSEDLPQIGTSGLTDKNGDDVNQALVRPPCTAACLQRAIPGEDRPFMDTSSITDWLLPQLQIEMKDEDDYLGVPGTTPVDGREYAEGHFGVYALNKRPPKIPENQTEPYIPSTQRSNRSFRIEVSKYETEELRRRGMATEELEGEYLDEEKEEN